MSLLNIGFLNEAIKEKNILKPNDILNYVRKRLIESIGNDGQQDGMDSILICIETYESDKIITYAAANNKPVVISDNLIIEHTADKMPVGKGERTDPFTLFQLNAKTGDMLYLYTDGFADQFGGPKGKKFKYKQLNELLLNVSNNSTNEQNLELISVFEKWKGDLEQVDDVLLVGIRI
jgi:serine phosphatase RsbU (regulator of sigma subunit)